MHQHPRISKARNEAEIRVILAEGRVAEKRYRLQEVLRKHNVSWSEYRKLEKEDLQNNYKPIAFETAEVACNFVCGNLNEYVIENVGGNFVGREKTQEEKHEVVSAPQMGNRQIVVDVSEPIMPEPKKKVLQMTTTSIETAGNKRKGIGTLTDSLIVKRVANYILNTMKDNENHGKAAKKFQVSRYVFDKIENGTHGALDHEDKMALMMRSAKLRHLALPSLPAPVETIVPAAIHPPKPKKKMPETKAVSMDSERTRAVTRELLKEPKTPTGALDKFIDDDSFESLLMKLRIAMRNMEISELSLADDGEVKVTQRRTFVLPSMPI